ncbi:hypothetical protein GUITHDRAFT_151486 [Guillardia theta CCMP2712]|uniref:Uncharacterized protein n=1 Tax=Guillardia theta (strain CCMP2712) TaxID=905079 RepID=L1JM14_GUITC|nr:hypothetical protein GUITHDRAFT_151486 [Guillardia theta CCMP2712]EKX49249.1 hypothetical protein GUITHDRAFT_151486 [Guillardia theta CCMP2712]|mmetsp:Transcript_38769/g.122205  ORF Transcript_38769/g.122205 Transcript_38769/m.122205 type:complete len:143 (-) Transcript_38769:795-1223(-)|eukprot:XP_005836229.1 hypothetical protein GUITHDRAFT_151486 [Guillardia theta CCMP2712]
MSGKDDVDETFSIVAGASSRHPEQAAADRSSENVTGSEANQATRDQFVQKLFKIDPKDYQNFSTEKKIRLAWLAGSIAYIQTLQEEQGGSIDGRMMPCSLPFFTRPGAEPVLHAGEGMAREGEAGARGAERGAEEHSEKEKD